MAGLKIVQKDDVLLPFCVPGYTLAMDFSLRHSALFKILDEADKIILRFGGRVYLAKDARLAAEDFHAMYTEYPQWIKTVNKYAPNKRFSSLLAQRLEL